MPDQQVLEDLITLFLAINPKPSDAQFHAMSEAIGVDKETVEAIAYRMLSEELKEDDAQDDILVDPEAVEAETKEERVLQDDYNPSLTSPDDLALNDGELVSDDPNPGLQEQTEDDGLDPVADHGVGLQDDQDATVDDGLPPPAAFASRLSASKE